MPTPAIQTTLAALKIVADDGERSREALLARINEVQNAIDGDSIDSVNEALQGYVEILGTADAAHVGLLSMVAGGLVEHGGEADLLSSIVLTKLEEVVEPAARFRSACMGAMPQNWDDPASDEDPHALFQQIADDRVVDLPDEAAAWNYLTEWYAPMVAVLSLSSGSREEAQAWGEALQTMSDWNEGASWLSKLLRVLDDESAVVIEPSSGLGVECRSSGISDNFQLQMLLMDAFPKDGSGGPRIDERFVQVARGSGPQQLDGTLTGSWNMYTWQATLAGGTLPSEADMGERENWIWGEGTPADIPVLDEHRVILLGPPSYQRIISPIREFSKLAASLTIERQLKAQDTQEWLRRMLDAKAAR